MKRINIIHSLLSISFIIQFANVTTCCCLAFTIPSNLVRKDRTDTTLNPNLSTRLYNDKKWGPRWNPRPDSEYYRRDDDDLGEYSKIHFGGRRRRSKFIAIFGKTRIFSLQRFLVVSVILHPC